MSRDYEYQWQTIMADNMFAEDAVISSDDVDPFVVRGIFFSGSYQDEPVASYAPSRLTTKEYFQVSSLSIPSEIENPWTWLEGMTLCLEGRNLVFRIHSVVGKRGGMLTLYLQEKKNE